jgi:transcription-repair coupling factor (superfamily II helicase)
LVDRFGPLPKQVQNLFIALQSRWMAQELGYERIILKNKQLRLYFVSNPDSLYFESDTFKHILDVIQLQVKNARLKNVGTNFMLVVDNIKGIQDVFDLLTKMKKTSLESTK